MILKNQSKILVIPDFWMQTLILIIFLYQDDVKIDRADEAIDRLDQVGPIDIVEPASVPQFGDVVFGTK